MKNFYRNLSTKKKVTGAFILIVAFIIILSTISLFTITHVNKQYKQLLNGSIASYTIALNVDNSFTDLRRILCVLSLSMGSTEDYTEIENQINFNLETIETNLNKNIEILDNEKSITNDTRTRLINNLQTIKNLTIVQYGDVAKKAIIAAKSNDFEAMSELDSSSTEIATNALKLLNTFVEDSQNADTSSRIIVSNEVRELILFLLIFSILIIIIIVLFAVITSNVIVNPITKLIKISTEVSKGNFNVNLRSNYKDDIGILSNNIANIIEVFNNMVLDINNITLALDNGETDERINTERYLGDFKNTVIGINNLADNTVNDIEIILNNLNEYEKGNFDYISPRFLGKKERINIKMDEFCSHLNSVTNDINVLVDSVKKGNLHVSINTDTYEGGWKNIINGLNQLIKVVEEPISEVSQALTAVSQANFNLKITSTFNGEFDEMKLAVNNTIDNTAAYINEISEILKTMANQNLDITIKNEYIGDFAEIKNALELIINNFNDLIKNIVTSSEQVALGSQCIAESSMSLAEGTTEQAAAIEQLTATIDNVSQNANDNTEKSLESNKLALKARNNTEIANREMETMLQAMNEINDASNNISNIIKVIDDIAFQTNILALNAAVEAARAGEHGKGFAVVAQEVRNLAARSQVSAKETTKLINISLEKAKQGSDIAHSTATNLRTITQDIIDISDISSKVAEVSKTQNEAIKEINIGIKQISDVITTNTSSSEESAATAEELASQSTLFKDTISSFKLKNHKN